MTDCKMTPDQMAEAIKKMVTENGDLLMTLEFQSKNGAHSYNTLAEWQMDGTPWSVFVP